MSPDELSHYHESWWDRWGKWVAWLFVGIFAVMGAILAALVIAGVLF